MEKNNLKVVNSLAALYEIIENLKSAYYDVHGSLIYFKEIDTKEKDWERLLKIRIKNQERFLQDIFKLVGAKWDVVEDLIKNIKVAEPDDEEEEF